jgi:hypothetical protein
MTATAPAAAASTAAPAWFCRRRPSAPLPGMSNPGRWRRLGDKRMVAVIEQHDDGVVRASIDGQPVGDFVDQAAAIDFVRALISAPARARGAGNV